LSSSEDESTTSEVNDQSSSSNDEAEVDGGEPKIRVDEVSVRGRTKRKSVAISPSPATEVGRGREERSRSNSTRRSKKKRRRWEWTIKPVDSENVHESVPVEESEDVKEDQLYTGVERTTSVVINETSPVINNTEKSGDVDVDASAALAGAQTV
jgi:hypothetical protein